MNVMNAPQLQEFSDDLDKIAVAMGAIRQNEKLGNGNPISEQEQDELLISQIKILRASARFSAAIVVLESSQIKTQLDALKSASAEMEKTLSKMKTVQDVIDFSTLAVTVAMEVVGGDITGVSASLDKLLGSIKEINKPQNRNQA